MDRRRRSYQLESLENRNLLSTMHAHHPLSTMHAHHGAAGSALRAKTVVVTGSFNGSFGAHANGLVDINGNGTMSVAGPVYAVGQINLGPRGLTKGNHFTGSVSLYTNQGHIDAANFSMSGVVPRSNRTPIRLTFNGNGVIPGLPHNLKGSGNLTVQSLNSNGAGNYTISFRDTGKH